MRLESALKVAVGVLARVVCGLLAGGVAGAVVGLLINAVNNLVLSRLIGAAYGSYSFWAGFFALLLFVPATIASLAWGAAYAVRQLRPAPPSERAARS